MKRIAALFAALLFAFAVVACDNGDDATTAPTDEPIAEEAADEAADEASE
jgi:hypothetical protein